VTAWDYHPVSVPRLTPAVRWLLIATVVAYLVQLVGDRMTAGGYTMLLGLSRWGMRHFLWWQVLSYAFLHGSPVHILINMLGLFFLGPETERALGTRRFVKLYLASAVIGGLGWLVLSPRGVCIGASGALFGVIGAFAGLFPHRLITLFVMMILPVTMPAWMLAAGLAVVELIYLVAGGGQVAYAAHLAGLAAGYVYARSLAGSRDPLSFADWARYWRRRRAVRGGSDERLDRILDKIATRGISSLSREEREFLDRVSRERRAR